MNDLTKQQLIDTLGELIYINHLTEQQLMDKLEELMKEGTVRSFIKLDGDPLNPDDWLYELVEDNSCTELKFKLYY